MWSNCSESGIPWKEAWRCLEGLQWVSKDVPGFRFAPRCAKHQRAPIAFPLFLHLGPRLSFTPPVTSQNLAPAVMLGEKASQERRFETGAHHRLCNRFNMIQYDSIDYVRYVSWSTERLRHQFTGWFIQASWSFDWNQVAQGISHKTKGCWDQLRRA